MRIPIEDSFEDVLMKAAVGQRLGHGALSIRSGLSLKEVRALLAGELNESHLRRLAPVLKLDVDKLVAMARGEWYPSSVELAGLECICMPFPEANYPNASTNCFVAYDVTSKDAIVFDTGTRAQPILEFLQKQGLKLQAVFITHGHRDHVGGYAELLTAAPAGRVYAPANEPVANAALLEPETELMVGKFRVKTVETNGHSRGALSYLVDGLEQSVAFVGDSIFCLSMGGTKQGYQLALDNNRKKLLSLPPATILCPGHGPMTTVAQELEHNPFF
ncbi:MBL fold metallo-hydrolase [Coraliomargarita sp. SDUM461004]|uniref:MBL fold metallo-hydrolase n=1 Tax=Thalassobacterium sedimentorum TaxID=3041258 RepID=A0ABU1AL95_9BACT|nr:MBL fold metallo-hydrolase [Coraliomargarita sp. SDUM461004]MDQ8195487.1 MBL fold metallo-hydrolase [Coraliomargarita sp. SDUM461004]